MATKPHTTAPAPSPLVSHCMELLESAGPVRSRRMFGGWGFYVDGLFVALLAADRLYLKVNEETRPRFEAAAGRPFVYQAKQQEMRLQYYTPPADAMDSGALMRPWVLLALQAAVQARAPQPARLRTAPNKRR